MSFKSRSLTLGLALLGTTATALASPVVSFGENTTPAFGVSGNPVTARNAFMSNLTGVGNQDFESLTGSAPLSLAFPGANTPTITATLTGAGTVVNNPGNTNGRYNTTTGGSKWWDTSGFFQLDFSSPISAFGFYGTDVGDFGGRVTLTLTDTNNVVTTLTVNNTVGAANGSLLFYGFIDTTTAYKRIVFGNTSFDTDGFGFDNMVVGDSGQLVTQGTVPEPASLGLVGLALAAAGLSGRVRPTKR